MSSPVLRAEGLTKHFGDFVAVDSVTFEVGQGEIFGYLGPNGSGKTTTLRMLLGLMLPTAGRSWLLGQPMPDAGEAARPRVGYMTQRFALYDELTVEENLEFYARAYGVRDPDRLKHVLGELELQDAARTRAGELSIGWRQRLALAGALVHRPLLLILDEPTSGVDPVSRRAFWDRVYALALEGVSALVTTHYLDEAEYCHRVGIMIAGQLRAIGSPDRLRRTTLPAGAWDVRADPLLEALDAVESDPHVLRGGLSGDQLRVIPAPGADLEAFERRLESQGFAQVHVERVEPSLEDVFLALATD